MSTRGMFVFADSPADTFTSRSAYCVYVHFDTYPKGAAAYLAGCLNSRMTWPSPRYEADEFAAGFVASIKAMMYADATLRAAERAAEGREPWDDLNNAGGNVRLAHHWDDAADIEWAYLITPAHDRGKLAVTACPTTWQDDRLTLGTPKFSGDLTTFVTRYGGG